MELKWRMHWACITFTYSRITSRYIFFFFNDFSFLRDGEGQSMNGGGSDREGDRILSRLQAVSTEPDAGLKPRDREIVTCAEVGRLTD